MSELAIVELHHNEPMTTSLAIAEGVQMDHASVIKLVRKYIDDIQEFGTLGFEIQKSGGMPTEFAWLNEQQATFLLTLMRNSPIVVAFKKALVKAFFELRDRARAGLAIDPVLSSVPAHGADVLVAADRTFRAFLRSARAAGLGLPKALSIANAQTCRRTGLDMISEMDAEDYVAGLSSARAPGGLIPALDPVEDALSQWAESAEANREYRLEEIIGEALDIQAGDKRSRRLFAKCGPILSSLGFKVYTRRDENGRQRRVWECPAK